MKSSRSSSQLTDGGAAGGVVWLDEPLAFPFLSFLDLGSCTGGVTSCVGGHGLGGIKSSTSSSQLTQVGAWGAAAWLDEPLPFPFLYFLDLDSCTGGGTSCVGGHSLGGMKSSMSSSQLTQVCAASGVVWLDEPLAFPFISFLILGSCTGGGTSCVGGHGLGAWSHPCRHPI